MIIGLTGTNGAGKTVAADHLQTKGFDFYSLSDEIRAELARRETPATRENLIAMGNDLRAQFGPSVLADRVKRKLRADRNFVIDSIRNPREIEVLRAAGDFRLLHLDAPVKIRYQRVRDRGGERLPASEQEFIEQETREMESGDPAHQQLRACHAEADVAIVNDASIGELTAKMDATVAEWLMAVGRPGWDEYFMQIARMVALRSNCMKRKVAAVIVKDRRIVSTGYNGTPRGVKNCNEGGCPRCNSLATSGTQLGECLCSHAEENAIVQASYHGIALKDSSLYSTFSPCLICTKMIINAGIREVVYDLDYPLNDVAHNLLREAGVELKQLSVD